MREVELNQLKNAQITPLIVDAEALVAVTNLAGIPGAVKNLTDKIATLAVDAPAPAPVPPAAPAGAQVVADHSAEERLYNTARDKTQKVRDRIVALNKLIATNYFKTLQIEYQNLILQLRTTLENKEQHKVSITDGGRRRKTKGKGKKSTKRRMPKAKGKRKTKARAQAKATRKNRRS